MLEWTGMDGLLEWLARFNFPVVAVFFFFVVVFFFAVIQAFYTVTLHYFLLIVVCPFTYMYILPLITYAHVGGGGGGVTIRGPLLL